MANTFGIAELWKLIPDAMCDEIINTAAYGGINYWADEVEFLEPEGTLPSGESSRYRVRESEEKENYHLSRDDVRRAWADLVRLDQRHVNKTIHGYFIESFRERDPQTGVIEGGCIDADAADVLVQVACFGEVVYG